MENSPKWLQRVIVCAAETALSRGDLLELTLGRGRQKKMDYPAQRRAEQNQGAPGEPIRTEALTELFNELDAEHKKLPNVERLNSRMTRRE